MTAQDPRRSDAYPAAGASDAFEARLAGRLAGHAEHGVRPFDAVSIASAAAHGRRSGARGAATALGRLGWLLAGAALAAGAIGGTMWAGSHGLLGSAVESPAASQVAVVPTAPVTPEPQPSAQPTEAPTAGPTPVPTAEPTPVCDVSALRAAVTDWNGAAGNRIATVTLTNTGPECRLAALQRPQLLDGNRTTLLDGDDPSHPAYVRLGAGATLSTEVDDANYCGPTPVAPATIAFVFAETDRRLIATPRTPTDTFGVPECFGPGQPGLITMHPWAP